MISVAKHMPPSNMTRRLDPSDLAPEHDRWRITDQLRKRGLSPPPSRFRRHGDRHPYGGQVVDPASRDLDALWNAEWEKNLLDAAMAKVKRGDPQKYQIFDLYVNKEWAPKKVAATFGISVTSLSGQASDDGADQEEVKKLEQKMS